jgi:16S rRNA (guanine527-N7)-methyltransferase
MTEEEAQAWLIAEVGVSRETLEQLDAFRSMVIKENDHQNLVSTASIDHFWLRHIVDSAQLMRLVDGHPTNWLDLGTGAGFPGMVIAILSQAPITFVESRRKRIAFLADSAEKLGLSHVTVQGSRLETMETAPFSVITARAFAPLSRLLPLAHRFSTNETQWLLPKGKSAQEEVASVTGTWQGVFHVKPSVTDPDAAIICATGVKCKEARPKKARPKKARR